MDENLFKQRTKQLALRFIEIVDALPKKRTADVIGRQSIRSGTSIGANYRAACRGKSTADVIAKLRIVEERGKSRGREFMRKQIIGFTLGAMVLALGLPGLAQQPGKAYRIGVLATTYWPPFDAFREG